MSIRWKTAQALEWRWWNAYFKNKEKESYYIAKKAYWLKWLAEFRKWIPVDTAKSVADLGCGPAGLFTVLQNESVTAADPLLDIYQEKLSFFNKADYPNVQFVTSTLEDFEASSQFDVVYCMNAINHVKDMEQSFQKLVLVVKKGGYVVVSIDAHNHLFFRYLFRLLPVDVLHPHQYNLEEYKSFLTKNNCSLLTSMVMKREFLFDHIVLLAQKN